MPFRQGEEVRGAHLGVIAEPEQRFPVSLADIVAQRPLEDRASRLQIAKFEQDKTENAASHTRFRRPRLGLGLPKEGLSCVTRLAILAAHEACQALRVVGDKARSSAVRRSASSLARA